MGNLFKAGDRVVCVDKGDYATIDTGVEYVVEDVSCGNFVRLLGVRGGYRGSRFVLASRPAPAPDPVHRPAHYARYAIEPITFIMANSLPFAVGNVVKYVLRYDAKNGREDLMKARRYIDMIIEDMDRKAAGTAGKEAL